MPVGITVRLDYLKRGRGAGIQRHGLLLTARDQIRSDQIRRGPALDRQ